MSGYAVKDGRRTIIAFAVLYICVYALQNANALCYNADITNILEADVKYG